MCLAGAGWLGWPFGNLESGLKCIELMVSGILGAFTLIFFPLEPVVEEAFFCFFVAEVFT